MTTLHKPSMRTLVALAAVLLTTSCLDSGSADSGRTSDAPKVTNDKLRIVTYTWPVSWNPHRSAQATDQWIFHQVFEGLVVLDDQGEYTGRLAEGWSFSENGRKLTFELRKGVDWHDGEPFTAQDVIFSYESLTSHADPSYQALMASVQNIEAPNEHRVVVHYSEPFAAALSTWTVPIIPAHLFPSDQSYDESSTRFRGVGTGPYRITAVADRDSVTLERNPRFNRPTPNFQTIVFKLMNDVSLALDAVRQGQVDVMRMRPADWKFNTPPDQWGHVIQKVFNPTYGFSYISWNQDGTNPFFSDRRVRRAIALAWNAEEANKMWVSDLADIAWGPLPEWSFYDSPNVGRLHFDPELAGKELDAAGWIDHDGDGIRDRDGIPFEFTLLTVEGMLFTNEIAHYLTTKLKNVGIKMEYVRVPYPELLERTEKGKFEAYILEWSGDADPDFLYSLFHSSQQKDGLNYGSYLNPEVDRLLEQGRHTLDHEDRVRIYQRAHEILYADQPYLFLFFKPTLWAVSTRIEGVNPRAAGLLLGYPGVLTWSSSRAADQPTGGQY